MLSDVLTASGVAAVGPSQQRSILLVTANCALQQNVLRYLSDTYRVHIHCSQEGLLGSLSRYKPDALIVDLDGGANSVASVTEEISHVPLSPPAVVFVLPAEQGAWPAADLNVPVPHAVVSQPLGKPTLLSILKLALAQRVNLPVQRVEDNIRSSEQQLQFVMDTMPQKIFTARANGDLNYANPAWLQYTGLTLAQFNEWGWTDAVHPDDLEENVTTWKHAIAVVEPYEFEQRFRNSKGEYRWHISRARPLLDDDGQVLLWVGSNTDSHDLKATKLELAQTLAKERVTAAKLADLANAALVLNAELSIQGLADQLATEARRIVGSHQSVVSLTDGSDWSQAVTSVSLSAKYEHFRHYDAKPNGSGIYAEVCRTNRPMRMTQSELESHALWRGFGGEKHRHPPMNGWLAVPLVGHGGRNLGLVQLSDKYIGDFEGDDEAVLTQLSVIAAVGIENTSLYESLRQQDRRKDEFLAMLAHELRNPLAPLRTGLDLLQTSDNLQQRRHIEQMMQRQVRHLIRLVDDLLDVARVNQGKVELQLNTLLLTEVVKAALETSQPLVQSLQHQLNINVVDEDVFVEGDLTRLAQVFSNLINNAAKYTPKGGKINVTLKRQGDTAVVQVADNGIGLPADALPKLFELFSQVSYTANAAYGGLGIGLSVVRKLVEMHHGTVEAQSEGVDQGSTFTVCLPVVEADSITAISLSSEKKQPITPAAGLKVLIVDDHREATETCRLLLEASGYEVCTALTGAQALTAAEAFQPVAVVLDITLPDMSGYEVATKLRSTPGTSNATLIAVTGWGSEADRLRAVDAGFDYHFTKPMDTKQLIRVLAEGLESSARS